MENDTKEVVESVLLDKDWVEANITVAKQSFLNNLRHEGNTLLLLYRREQVMATQRVLLPSRRSTRNTILQC